VKPPRTAAEIDLRPFELRWHGATVEGEGARWWNESVAVRNPFITGDSTSRRQALLVIGGMVAVGVVANLARCDLQSDPQVSMEALKVQQQMGWNAGEESRSLIFTLRASPTDAGGRQVGPDSMTTLWSAMRPVQAAWVPYYIPTLFRSLADERSGSLRGQMSLVHTDAMDQAFGRGRAMADVFGVAGAPDDVALVIDLPGPEAVALAAGLSVRFEPVWLFDNWPHPLGVVPSHLVLGAVLYYRSLLEESAGTRAVSPAAGAVDGGSAEGAARPVRPPPMFVLDSNRLAPYHDAADQFDNRYLARLPSAQALRAAGYRRVLYVRTHDGVGAQLRELDDLNDDFVAYGQGGVDVRLVSADAFQLDAALAPAAPPSYVWGGSPYLHTYFWHSYGWSTASPARPSYVGLARSFGSSAGADYRPVARPTMFSSRTVGGLSGVGKQRPSGFGLVSVRQSASGRITAVGAGRSGSFGRMGSSSFG